MVSRKLMGVWAALDVLLLAAGAVSVAFSIVWRAENTLLNLVITSNYLTVGLALGITLLATFVLSIGAIIQKNHVTLGLVVLNYTLLIDAIGIVIIGTYIWFFTLQERNNFQVRWAAASSATRIKLQDQLQCCGYFNGNDLAEIGGSFCTSRDLVIGLNNSVTSNFCVQPITNFADTTLNNIFTFHVLLKQRAQLQATSSATSTVSAEATKVLADIQDEITSLGGLEQYQRMSAVGQGIDRGGGSERVLIKWLKDLGLHRARQTKLRLLEVGALKPDNYNICANWVQPTSIDLRSRHPSIVEQDFLQIDPAEHYHKWDVISLSLVLNFVPVPQDRGRMLSIAHDILAPKGHLFLALPSACVNNSRYLDIPTLKAMLAAIGFKEIRERWKEGRKMAYWLYERAEVSDLCSREQFTKKKVLRQGNRNNFCILF
ncbi:hypothetical protein H0H93_011563 [Arthromyces matolae]|nr:hypothetical protein H0H93_011563 [Arthromyces matolae]